MTLQYRAWQSIRRGSCSPTELADRLGLHYEHAKYIVRRLRQFGHVAEAGREGRFRVYRVTENACPPAGHYEHTRRPRS